MASLDQQGPLREKVMQRSFVMHVQYSDTSKKNLLHYRCRSASFYSGLEPPHLLQPVGSPRSSKSRR